MLERRRSRSGVAIVGVFAMLLAAVAGFRVQEAAARQAVGPILTSPCLDPTVDLSVEENRLTFTLPDNSDPSVLQETPFAQQMIEGAGLEDLGPSFVKKLCRAESLDSTQALVEKSGRKLWRRAVQRAQRRTRVEGFLPYSDDRPLYWTRLQSTAALRQWEPGFELSVDDRIALITAFDRASRGMFDIQFPAGDGVKRVIVSGFDPYTLDGGDTGTAPGSVGNNIRHGNPSGATALSLDGTRYRTANGTRAFIEAYNLPVNFPEFRRGYLEDTVGPFMLPGPRQVDASLTVSQAGGYAFNLEEWNARYHGTSRGNDLFRPCPQIDGVPQLAIYNNECNSQVVQRWGGPATERFDLNNPPQWTQASLPIAEMIAADTGATVPRPPGDEWPDPSVAFGVVWHTNYTQFPDCSSPTRESRNSPPPVEYPPPTPPIPPDEDSCSYSGGGGNYLSNESAYRNTLLRDRLGLDIPAGHIHTPSMQHFDEGNLFNPSDTTFNAWRLAIVEQGANLIYAVADTVAGQDTWKRFASDRPDMLKKLANPIEHCFAQRDDVDSDSPMFDGCWDWHSAVHGAYSLHLIYRETGDKRYLKAANAKIKRSKVADELEYMRTTIRNRENPYGFSWLLSLVKEREEVTGKKDLRPLAVEAVEQIRQLVASLTPEQARERVLVPNYPNLSWALIHLGLWAEYTGDTELKSFVHEKTEDFLLDPELDDLCPVEADTTPDHREFFPPCLMRLAAVGQTWDVSHATLKSWMSDRVPSDLWIEPVTAPVRNHSHALNFSRSYALWHLWEATDNVQHRSNFTQLIRYQIGRPDLWDLEATLGYAVSHWVAQFGVRAIAESYGDE